MATSDQYTVHTASKQWHQNHSRSSFHWGLTQGAPATVRLASYDSSSSAYQAQPRIAYWYVLGCSPSKSAQLINHAGPQSSFDIHSKGCHKFQREDLMFWVECNIFNFHHFLRLFKKIPSFFLRLSKGPISFPRDTPKGSKEPSSPFQTLKAARSPT